MAFTLRKLQSMEERTRLRKLLLIFREAQKDPVRDPIYLKSLLPLLPFTSEPWPQEPQVQDRYLNLLQHRILDSLGQSWADWDAQNTPDSPQERRFPLHAYLEDLRSPFNLGAVFRTAEAHGFSSLILSDQTPDPSHPRCRRTAMGTDQILPWTRGKLADLEALGPVFALELGGTKLGDFSFPDHGTVLIGSEELGLSPEALALADSSAGRVTIPLFGRKASLNLAVAFGILASRWIEIVHRKSLIS